MKFVKVILVLFVLLVLAVLGFSLAIPSEVHVERTVEIEAPAQHVFDKVNNLKEWPQWSPWYEMEPEAEYTYSGPDAGEGAKQGWKGEKVGQGSQEIVVSTAPTHIETKLEFADYPDAKANWSFAEMDGKTTVMWSFDTNMGMNPIGKFFGLRMDSMLGPEYEKGLAKLKQLCEEEPPALVPAADPVEVVEPEES